MSKTAVQRAMLQQHRAQINKISGGKLKPSDIRPGTIRLLAAIKNGVPTLKFNTDDGVSVLKAQERLLPKSNLFYANFMGFGLVKVPVLNSKALPGNAAAVSYPDPRIFTAAGIGTPAGATESQCLEAIYNGTLNFTTDQDVRLANFHMSNFRLVPQTQQGTTTIPNLWGPATIDLSTSFMIWGDRRNNIQIDVPTDSDLTNLEGAATGVNYAMLIFEGFEVENAANNARAIQDYFKSI